MKIGIFDSGIGGTTVYAAVKKLLPDAEYFYLADSKNCPYGNKSQKELENIVSKNVETLRNKGAEIIVIACNTATTKCINFLREKYPDLKFIGTEPAIKLATSTHAKKILVLATPGTIESERTAELVRENREENQQIDLLACAGLAETIEKNPTTNIENLVNNMENLVGNMQNLTPIMEKLTNLFQNLPKDYDVVVLGCTHYPLIKSEIQKFFPTAKLLDGADGVARQVLKQVEKLTLK